MSDDEETDRWLAEMSKSVSLRGAHSEITRSRYPAITEEQKAKILAGLFVTPEEYAQYVIHLREQDERETKEYNDREAARLKAQETDWYYWKQKYLGMVHREEERLREWEQNKIYLMMLALSGVVGGVFYILKRVFGW